jgi:hypothetical protein
MQCHREAHLRATPQSAITVSTGCQRLKDHPSAISNRRKYEHVCRLQASKDLNTVQLWSLKSLLTSRPERLMDDLWLRLANETAVLGCNKKIVRAVQVWDLPDYIWAAYPSSGAIEKTSLLFV